MRRSLHHITSFVGILLAMPLCNAAAPVREAGVLTIAVYTDFEPFSRITAGECGGVDASLARHLAERLHLKPKLLPFNAGEDMADDLRNMVWRGDVLHYGPADVMLHVPVDRRFSAANEQALIFAPYYRESLVLLRDTRVLPAAPSPADLIGKFVAAEQGTAAASALLGAESGALRETTRITRTPQAALQLLLNRQVAAALVTRAQAEAALHSTSDRTSYAISSLELNGIPSRGWAVGMAVKSDNTELAGQIAQALQVMSGNGELREIFAAEGLTLVEP
jgi:ABC-type amino acid transport substrate-binding protein